MARRESAARRYAEAAFEVATRDDALEAWRHELDMAASVVSDRHPPTHSHLTSYPSKGAK